jgi:hypothetical protein
MARKKHRRGAAAPISTAAASSATAVKAGPPAVTASKVTLPAPAEAKSTTGTREYSVIELVGIRCARWLGSLQVAVILLGLFALMVLLGTLMEHWYSTKIAQELVYKSWWFVLLLFLLSVNIFFAAVKKWPWKKHQTGFLITHVGLLTMLAGGILNGLFGTDAGMQLQDTDDPEVRDMIARTLGHVPQSSGQVIYNDVSMIRVVQTTPGEDPHESRVEKEYKGDFWAGALPWKATDGKVDFTLSFLNWLEHPFGRGWHLDLGKNAYLQVIDFLPHARREDFSAAERGFPALKVQLRSARFDQPMEAWLASNLRNRKMGFGQRMPVQVEIIGHDCPLPIVKTFLNPPRSDRLGTKGVLAVAWKEKEYLLPVDECLNRTISPAPGLEIKVTRYLANMMAKREDGAPEQPAVEFELVENGVRSGPLLVMARIGGLVIDKQDPHGKIYPQGQGGRPCFWLHPPDMRWGQPEVRGVLQFIQGEDQKLYYRSFANRDQGFDVESAGTVAEKEDPIPIWSKMQWKFRILEYLPHAREEERYLPVYLPPGKESEEDKVRYLGAIQCRLTAGKDTYEFWVGQLTSRPVTVGGNHYTVQFTNKRKNLGFQIKLERAEQTVDPGTRAAASYSSYVQLFDREKNINGERRLITMNEPLEHRGYKFYQSSYQFLKIWDANGKPVSISGFTVGSDPGLGLKYAGSLMLGLGIACMFYMKAYFFKPRGRKTTTPAAPEKA